MDTNTNTQNQSSNTGTVYPEFGEVPVKRENKRNVVDLTSWAPDKRNQFADHLANAIKSGTKEIELGSGDSAILFNCGTAGRAGY